MYEDGDLAEIFIRISKQGSTLAGLLDAFAIAISIALQHGVPLKVLARKFVYGRFEPAGFTDNPDIQIATSITDYIFRYLGLRFLKQSDLEEIGLQAAQLPNGEVVKETVVADVIPARNTSMHKGILYNISSGVKDVLYAETMCRSCGGMMIQTGSCKTCMQCGSSSGGC